MIWVLVIIIVVVIYNAEKMPSLMNKIKSEVPHTVEVVKKASKDIKEKAQAAHTEKKDVSQPVVKEDKAKEKK